MSQAVSNPAPSALDANHIGACGHAAWQAALVEAPTDASGPPGGEAATDAPPPGGGKADTTHAAMWPLGPIEAGTELLWLAALRIDPAHQTARRPSGAASVVTGAGAAAPALGSARRRATIPDRVIFAGPGDGRVDLSAMSQALSGGTRIAESIAPVDWQQLADSLRVHGTRVLVLHVDLLETIKVTDLLRLRRQFPAVYWVLARHSASPCRADLVVKFQARGCVECDDTRNFARAIDAVIAGDLWLPRCLTNSLYFRLLNAQPGGSAVNPQETASKGAALTPRESEAIELMQQGLTNSEIAWRLQIGVNTVKKHLKSALDKRGVQRRRSMLARALLAGFAVLSALAEFVEIDLA